MSEIIVLLPDPEGPTSAIDLPAGAMRLMFFSTGTPAVYSNQTSRNSTLPSMSGVGGLRGVLLVFARLAEDFAHPLQSRERLGELRSDRDDLHDRPDDQREVERERDQIAGRHFVGDDLMAADEHHHRADGADEERGHRAGGGDRRASCRR